MLFPSSFDTTPILMLAVETSTLITGVVGAAIGMTLGMVLHRLMTGTSIRQAKEEAQRIHSTAEQEATNLREKAALDTEKKAIERREQLESELSQTRNELREQERRISKREDNLDRKMDMLGVKEKHLEDRAQKTQREEDAVKQAKAQTQTVLEEQKEKLLQLAGFTAEAARDQVLQRVEDECGQEINTLRQNRYLEMEEGAREKSCDIILTAIQRYAGEYTTESTVRSIPIPSDDMKGRIIGREGRNIRAIEKATGVDVLVDDTPGVISVSCFDKVRQTIASEALQKLVADGRVHPSRIEEIVETVRKDVGERIVRYGRDASNEANVPSLHPKVSEAIGKLYFRSSFGQNILKHSIEVAYLSQIIADLLGLDGNLARRCGFLHDIGKAMDHEQQGTHPKLGMEFLRKYNEREEVLNAAGGHHGDIPATSPYTPIVMAADAISGARPGARRESMEQYIQRLEQLEAIARENKGVNEAYAIQAGREVRVIIDAGKLSDSDAFGIARNIAQRVSEEMTFPGEIKVTVVRETRAVEYAT